MQKKCLARFISIAKYPLIMKYHRGFTLIEIMTCLAITAILFLFALFANASFYQRNTLEMAEDELINALHYARNMAIATGHSLTLTPLSKAQSWDDGMMLSFQDKILYRWQWHYLGTHIEWKGFQSNHYLTFSPSLKQATCNGSFLITSQSAGSKKIVINRIGRIRYS